MSDYLCDICKKNVAKIQISGKGKFCLDCHNDNFLKNMGIEDTFHYAPSLTVMEPSGESHTFRVEHMILGSFVTWDAYEINGSYHFKEISDIGCNGTAVARKFFQKIVDGVCTKTFEKICWDDSILGEDRNSHLLKDKGTIYISEDEDSMGNTLVVIDGEKYTGEELAGFLSSYPGFMMQYQIHDASEPILKEDEYLMPVHITKKSLLEELEVMINICGDRGFISYKDTLAFDVNFYKLTDKLEVLYRSSKKDEAISAGREIVRTLSHIETDDDYFPRNNIELVCKIVDPYGIDEELEVIVQEWEDSF